MNKISIIFTLLFVFQGVVRAQNQSEGDTVFLQLFGVAGGFEVATSGQSLSFSMGELFVSTETNYGQTLTQGFQQGDLFKVLDVVSLPELKFDVTVFPNPTSSYLHVKVNSDGPIRYGKDYVVELYNIVGQMLEVPMEYIDDQTIELDVKRLPVGAYVAKVYGVENANWVSSFKITKIGGNE